MKLQIVVCDRCGEDIGPVGKKIPVVHVRMQRGDEVTVRELCVSCGSQTKKFLEGKGEKPAQPEKELDESLMEQLSEVRKTAARALERYAEGASPDELVKHLRDVSSGARRR